MVNAEELGVTSANVDEMKASSTNPNVRRLGVEGVKVNGWSADDWGYNIIKQVATTARLSTATSVRAVRSASPWSECVVEQGWPAVRAAYSLNARILAGPETHLRTCPRCPG